MISHLQIDHYTIYKIQPTNIKSKSPQKRKKLKKVLDFQNIIASI